MAYLFLDLCLTDIPKELIKTAPNGKKYLKARVCPRKSPDADGYDHYIAAFVPSDQRREGDPPVFIGKAKEPEHHIGGQDFKRRPASQPEDLPEDNATGLPF